MIRMIAASGTPSPGSADYVREFWVCGSVAVPVCVVGFWCSGPAFACRCLHRGMLGFPCQASGNDGISLSRALWICPQDISSSRRRANDNVWWGTRRCIQTDPDF